MLKVPRGHAYEATAVGGGMGPAKRKAEGTGSGRERPLT